MTSHVADFHRVESSSRTLKVGCLGIEELACQYGTPLYVFDGKALQAQMENVGQGLGSPRIRLLYSIKANAGLALLARIRAAGFGLDACSPGDVYLARRAGAQPHEISYTAVGLGVREIAELSQAGIHLNLDSIQEAERYAATCPGRPAGLRVVPGIEAGFHPHCRSGTWGGKFGIPPEDLPAAVQVLSRAGCAVDTLHAHIGSSIAEAGPHLQALDRLLAVAEDIPTVQEINLGGGLAAPFHPDDRPYPLSELRAGIEDRLGTFERKFARSMIAVLEPGELLVSEAGSLLVSVLLTKRLERDGKRVSLAIVDGGMNLFPAHSLYGSYLHVYVSGKEGPNEPRSAWDIYGNTNQTGDRMATALSLPEIVSGDLLLFRNAGSYAWCRSTNFNQRPRPGEVWVEGGQAVLVREPETLHDLHRGQHALI